MTTDTIIVTSNQKNFDVTKPNIVKILQKWLGSTILLNYKILPDNPIELIILRKFKRILIISPDVDISSYVFTLFQTEIKQNNNNPILKDLQFSYSLTNTHGIKFDPDNPNNSINQDQKEYLKLPPSDKLFLISPPSSPPPEFDYSRCEEVPQLTPNALHIKDHSNSTILHELESTSISSKPKIYTLLTSDVANIVINQCENIGNNDNTYSTIHHIKTAVPPRSIFDTDEEIASGEDT
ncbi:Rcn1p PWA37_004831 [Arxiozyma heterogenica]|uniref:Rcn1p n=1 Tax=Arxiozyma heterogenica TaxID=278026 RepID=UPI002EFB2ACB